MPRWTAGVLEISVRDVTGMRFRRGSESPEAADDQRERHAQQQHQRTKNEEALAHTPAVGDAAHQRRDHDRGEPLARLTQSNNRTLLMAANRSRLDR